MGIADAESESLSVKKTLKSDRNSRLSLVGWVPSRGLPSAADGDGQGQLGSALAGWLAGRFEEQRSGW